MTGRWMAIVAALIGACSLVGCASTPPADRAGTLLVIGGGLDDDNKPVYERFAELARRAGPPRIVIATAASGDQDAAAKGKVESLGSWCPGARVDVIRRETPTAETVALIDGATAMFFTGGDQKRIVDRYRPGGAETDESRAIRRLLARGGVIAGTSAGAAMMSDVMFHTGRSAEALGIRTTRASAGPDDDPDQRGQPQLGPQIGPGMALVPWVFTDSHFFERNRVGRLVAALEQTGQRLGLGVGEDACVEIDLSSGELVGTSVAESLLVDVGALRRDGLTRSGARALMIRQGSRVSLPMRLATAPQATPARPPGPAQDVPVVEPGQNRQLASWRLFTRAAVAGGGARVLRLDGWLIEAWPAGDGESVFTVGPVSAPMSSQ